MKRIFLIVAVSMIFSAAFAQKKKVSIADKATWEEAPNFTEARQNIQEAMLDSTTSNQPKTWFVAGMVEMRYFDMQALSPQDEAGMYKALKDAYSYFLKTVELEKIPNEKGKVSTKYTKQIRQKLDEVKDYFYYGGGYFFRNDDKENAYAMFSIMDDMCNQEFMADANINCQDTIHMDCRYFASVVALQMNDYEKALNALNRAKEDNYNGLDVYNYIAYSYGQLKDTVNQIAAFKEGLQKYGAAANGEDYAFMPRLINIYIAQNKASEAISLIENALKENPADYEYLKVLGSLYYEQKNTPKAIEALEKAVEANPNYADAYGELGRIYYNEAITVSNDANEIQDNALYSKTREEKVIPAFMKAAPYYETALKLNPTEVGYLYNLKNIYYNVGDGDNLKRIETLLGE